MCVYRSEADIGINNRCPSRKQTRISLNRIWITLQSEWWKIASSELLDMFTSLWSFLTFVVIIRLNRQKNWNLDVVKIDFLISQGLFTCAANLKQVSNYYIHWDDIFTSGLCIPENTGNQGDKTIIGVQPDTEKVFNYKKYTNPCPQIQITKLHL